jgi:hypothetical protein
VGSKDQIITGKVRKKRQNHQREVFPSQSKACTGNKDHSVLTPTAIFEVQTRCPTPP